jgi:hypothetical protein
MPDKSRYLVFLLPLLLFISCRTARNASGSMPELKPLSFLLEKIAKSRITTDWLSAKAAIAIESPEMNISFSSNIRLIRDSVIWINFKKLSIEAARAMITKDSVFIINYLGKQYIARDLKFLEDNFNLPGSFDMLQDIILGNPVLLDSVDITAEVDTFAYVLAGQSEKYKNEYWFDSATFGLKKMHWEERFSRNKISLLQTDFSESYKGAPFSMHRYLEYFDDRDTRRSADIQFSEVEFTDPKPLRFEVPEHYERM